MPGGTRTSAGASVRTPGGRRRKRRIGALFTVLVCPLDGVNGADGGQAGAALARALKGREGLRVRALKGSPTAVPRRSGGLVPLLSRTTRTGQHWLAREGADVLLWGQRAGDTMRLSVVAHGHRQDLDAPFRLHPWSTLQLPLPLTPAGADLLHAFVLAAMAPLAPVVADAHGRAMDRALARVELHLAEGHAPPGPLRDGVRVAIGLLQRTHGLRRRDPVRLGRAVRLLESGLDGLAPSWPKALRTLARMDWAEAVIALPTLTEGRDDAGARVAAALLEDRLDDAVEACEAALATVTVEHLPIAFASVQTTLARALRRQAGRDQAPAPLDRAVAALTAARMVWTEDADPERWRRLWLAEGMALADRAALMGDDAAAHASAAWAFATLLASVSAETDPETWARARSNLGSALLGALGRTPYDAGAPDLLHDLLDRLAMAPDATRGDGLTNAVRRAAAGCFREALAVQERLGLQAAARVTRRNLDRMPAVHAKLASAPMPSVAAMLPDDPDNAAARESPPGPGRDSEPEPDPDPTTGDAQAVRQSAVVLAFPRRSA